MAHIEKRAAGRWRARYRAPDGRERSKTFDRRSDADRWLASVQTSKARGEWVDPALGRRTFASWAEEWSTTIVDLRPSTLDRDTRAMRTHLLPRFGAVPLSRITNSMVRAFLADLLSAGTHSPATVRKVGQILGKIMRGAVDAGLITRSPCDGVRLPAETRRQMRFLRAEEVAALADAAGPEYSTLIFTLDRYGHLYQGLDGALADGLDAVLRDSRGLTAAWRPS